MKRICILVAAFATIIGGPTAAQAKDEGVKPHYEIRNKDFWKYLHTDSLADINKGKVKAVTFIKSANEADLANEKGEVYNYNFNKSGLLTNGSYTSSNGSGYDFKIELNDYKRPAKINWLAKYVCPDSSTPESTVETVYIPFYDRAGRIQLMREETMKIDGKKVNHINKYVVKPGPTGAPVSLICLEDQSLFVNFKPNRDLQDCQIFSYGCENPGQSMAWLPYNVSEAQAQAMTAQDLDYNIPADATVEYDEKGNWCKKYWKDANGNTVGIIRNIVYF